MESKQTKTSKKTPTSASTRDAALRVVLEVVDEKGCGFVPTLERLGQQATCKAFALCDVGIATNAVRDGTFSHRSDGPRTVDAAIAQRLAAALDSAAVKPESGAGTQTFAVAWAARAERAAARARYCETRQRRSWRRTSVALVGPAVRGPDPRRSTQAIAALLCEVELAPEGLSSSENGMIEGLSTARPCARSWPRTTSAGVTCRPARQGRAHGGRRSRAATRGEATSRLRMSMF